MTAIMQMLTFLGDHFYFVLIAFFEISAALALLVWPKCHRTAHAGAFLLPEEEQMLLQEIGRDASEAFLLMRRYDSMVLGAVGDVQALLGVSLQQLQDDVTAMYRNIKNPELGSRMERSYRAWRCEKPLEYELEMADGQWLHMSIAPCRNPAYELLHFHRSTAMHERERGYEQRLDKAEAASQFKTSFLFRMSHEIRTPMNGIIGMLTLMKGKIPADHAAMQYVEKAEELSDHLLSLINDILDMSRIEAGKVELENAPFSLRAFGKTLDDMFARQMEKKGVAFAVRYEELTADWVLGDSLRLNQVGHVQLRILIPGAHSLVVDQRIGAGMCHRHIRILFDGLLYTLLIFPGGLNLNGLDVVLKLLLYAVAKAVGHTAFVLVEGLIQSDVGGSQTGVALGHDVVRAEHAAECNRAHGYCRCIDFRQLQTGLHIGRGQVLLVIVLGVGSAFLQDHFTAIDLFLGLMDGLHHLVMILQNILSLHSRLAGRDGRCYAHNSSTKDHDGRACLLQLIAVL